MRSSGKEHELFTTENDQNEQTRAFSVKPTLSSRHRRKRPKDWNDRGGRLTQSAKSSHGKRRKDWDDGHGQLTQSAKSSSRRTTGRGDDRALNLWGECRKEKACLVSICWKYAKSSRPRRVAAGEDVSVQLVNNAKSSPWRMANGKDNGVLNHRRGEQPKEKTKLYSKYFKQR